MTQHFGLGEATAADLEICWPSGKVQRLEVVPAHQFILVDGDRGLVTPAAGEAPEEEGA